MENSPTIKQLSGEPPVNAEKHKTNNPEIQETQKNIAKNVKNLAFDPKPMPHEKYNIILTVDAQLPIVINNLSRAKDKDEALKQYNEQIISRLEEIIAVSEYLKPAFVEQAENCLSLAQNQTELSYKNFKEFIKSLDKEVEFQRSKIIGEDHQEPERAKKFTSAKRVPVTSIRTSDKPTQGPKKPKTTVKKPQIFKAQVNETIEERNMRIIMQFRKEQ
ncbi:hypothetical protein HZA39_00185 [Candidatus Peregrinibacteria bacterium]|nr:hypothetical protein [Candidatus Peregrinibacteria bacterium]